MLLVDDSPHDQALIRSAFNRIGSGAVVDTAPDVGVAIGMIEGGLRPVLTIVDLGLVGESGLELVDWIRNESEVPWLPIVVLSGSDDTADLRAAHASGANAYLVKPGSVEEVDDLIRRIDAFWLGASAFAAELSH